MTRVVQAEAPGKREARMARVQALLDGRLGSVVRETMLRVSNLQLGDERMVALLRRIEYATPLLVELDLGFNVLRAGAMRALAESPFAQRLEALILTGNELGTDGVEALASGHFPALRELGFAWCALDDGAARVLAGTQAFPALRQLALRRNALTDKGAALLASSTSLRATLTSLTIDYNDEMSMKGRRLLSEAFGPALVD